MNSKDDAVSKIGSSGDPNAGRNRLGYLRVAVMVATTIGLASMAPPGLAVAAISSLAFISAVVIAAFALLYREGISASHFTRWDEAAAMLLVSLGAGLFVDPVAVEAAIAEATQR